jgi:hypothetical protein
MKNNLASSLKGFRSSQQGSMIAESAALKRGAEFLNRPGIDVNNGRISGYEYKKWTPTWIPFIQASTGIWSPVTTTPDTANNWQNGAAGAVVPGAEHLPFNIFIPSGGKFDFQLFTPKDHPFLLLDVKVSATLRTTEGDDPPVTTNHGRWKGPFNVATAPGGALFRKLAYPDNEGIYTSITAVSPGGKPIWGGVQNSVGMDNDVRTVGPVPHTEVVPLANSQNCRSGKGALQHHLLFPSDGILRVTVENHNPNNSSSADVPDGAFVNGVAFGYVIME